MAEEPLPNKILVEPINGRYIEHFMNALRTSCGRSMFEVLSYILEQSEEDRIKVKLRERREFGGLKGRRFSGGGSAAAHIPTTFAQISPAFERLIKQVCRHKTGLVDLDLPNGYYSQSRKGS